MAAVGSVLNQNGHKNTDVEKSSSKGNSFSPIETAVDGSVENVINKSTLWSEEDKKRTIDRFWKIYQDALEQNTETQSGLSSGNDNGTCYEPVDEKLREHYNSAILQELDDQMITVTSKRKYHPYKCAQHMSEQCKYLYKQAKDLQARPRAVVLDNLPLLESGVIESTCERYKQSNHSTRQIMKSIPELLEDTTHLYRAAALNANTPTSMTEIVLRNPSPHEGKMFDSLTPLKKKLRESQTPTVSRTLRSSPRLKGLKPRNLRFHKSHLEILNDKNRVT